MALAILPASLAFAGGSTSGGSQILNGQVNLHVDISNVNADIANVNGDAVAQSVAAGNVLDVTTMQDTNVVNNQYTSSVDIGSHLDANVQNVWGSVGLTSQATCNSASVSTDPTTTDVSNDQDCEAQDPYATINAGVKNVAGDVSIAASAAGNVFEEDTNAPNAPVVNNQVNKSSMYSTVNANVNNVGGSVGVSGAAIGNSAQIIHYSTDPQ